MFLIAYLKRSLETSHFGLVAGADFLGPVNGGLQESFGLYPFVSDVDDAGFVFVAAVLGEEPVA
jgi:hypothetical protein